MRCVHLFDLDAVNPLGDAPFRTFLAGGIAAGDRLLALFAERCGPGRFLVHAALGGSFPGKYSHGCVEVSPKSFPTLTDVCPGAHWFEREIYDMFGILPQGHPELNPLRFHEGWEKRFFPMRGDGSPSPEPRRGYRFLQVRGEGIHEIAVGPVHAGIIEPGHFRFSCAGETIQNLEIQLGYQHKGTESLFTGAPGMRQLLLSESISGDTAVGHSNACARLLEQVLGTPAEHAAEKWRSVALEVERIANHCGDLGGLSTDIGYLFGASHFSRLRGTALNLLMRLTGNRFGRGLNRIGGIGPRVPGIGAEDLLTELARLGSEVEEAGSVLLEAPSVVARMEGTGRLLAATAKTLQIVGVVGRASGRDIDARRDFPSPCFEEHPPRVVVAAEGDVLARARIRYEEMRSSFRWLSKVLSSPFAGTSSPHAGPASGPGRRTLAVSVEEGWRGEIVHAAIVEGNGHIVRYKIADPSFHNWPGLSFAVQKNVVSDFPLCNKSFNLSYSGADL
ncbi:MAG: NADH-quinone oxidoreductase subunit C [Deltaproteobacteria bacterium]|nr:NADH-quinone oxidoreductase subunit C [Deltaproteobacteria bacterium]